MADKPKDNLGGKDASLGGKRDAGPPPASTPQQKQAPDQQLRQATQSTPVQKAKLDGASQLILQEAIDHLSRAIGKLQSADQPVRAKHLAHHITVLTASRDQLTML